MGLGLGLGLGVEGGEVGEWVRLGLDSFRPTTQATLLLGMYTLVEENALAKSGWKDPSFLTASDRQPSD